MIVVSGFSKTNHLQESQLQEEYYTEVSKPGKFLYHKNFNKVREKSGYKKPAFGREIESSTQRKDPVRYITYVILFPLHSLWGFPLLNTTDVTQRKSTFFYAHEWLEREIPVFSQKALKRRRIESKKWIINTALSASAPIPDESSCLIWIIVTFPITWTISFYLFQYLSWDYNHCPIFNVLFLCLLPKNLGRNVTRSTWGSALGGIHRFTCSRRVARIQSHCALSHMRKNALAFNETEYDCVIWWKYCFIREYALKTVVVRSKNTSELLWEW